MNTQKFSGVFTALVTPFKDEKIDFTTLEKLIEYQIEQGVQGIIVVGTTGESPTLEEKERIEVIECAVAKAKKRVQIWAGTGSNCTRKAVAYTKEAHRLGVDGMLVVAPYYNRPNQEGLFIHFSQIAEATNKPILLYSIPSRCGVEIGIGVLEQLRGLFRNVVGIKESGGSCNRVSQIVKSLDKEFIVLSGDDSLTLPFIAIGAQGVVSVASNLVGKELVKMVNLALQNNLEEAAKINRQYYPFFRSLMLEPNPIPIKYVLYKNDLLPSPEVRLPLCAMSDKNVQILMDCLHAMQRG